MKTSFKALLLVLMVVTSSFAQRTVGVRRLQIDDSSGNLTWLISNLGSLGIGGSGETSGIFPNTNALLTIASGLKPIGLLIDGGSEWGLDLINSPNSLRTSGASIFGDGVGPDNIVFNLGAGNFTINGDPNTVFVLNSDFIVNGTVDATATSTSADPVWDARINGDMHVLGRLKIGPSSISQGTSPTLDDITATLNFQIGTNTPSYLSLVTNSVEQMRLRATGGINIPTSSATGVGVVYQNNVSYIHSFGTDNFFAGRNAGNLITPGFANTGIGVDALANNAPGGHDNTAVGHGAMQNNNGGFFNTAIGVAALRINGGVQNVAIGNGALGGNIVGGANTGVGFLALSGNIGGQRNTAVGNQALQNNRLHDNTAVGSNALQISNANFNSAFGSNALSNNIDGTLNTAIGFMANVVAEPPVLTNATAIGAQAQVGASNSLVLGSINTVNGATADTKVGIGTTTPQQRFHVFGISGTKNVRLGSLSGAGLTTPALVGTDGIVIADANGDLIKYNVATVLSSVPNSSWLLTGNTLTGTVTLPAQFFGSISPHDVIIKANNTEQMRLRSGNGVQIPTTLSNGIGVIYQNGAKFIHSFGTDNFFAGRDAGNISITLTGTGNTATGVEALGNNTTGSSNTASGKQALFTNTTGNKNTGVGEFALSANTSGSSNTATGVRSMRFNSIGYNNTATGVSSLFTNNNGHENSAFGVEALFSSVSGSYNTASGYRALYTNNSGSENTASGVSALHYNTDGARNTATGVEALYFNVDGYSNTANGVSALFSNTDADSNTGVGFQSLFSNTTGDNNTAIGLASGYSNSTGFNNTFLGTHTDASGSNFINASAIGHGAVVCASNSMVFGDGNVVSWGFGTCPIAGNAIEVGNSPFNGNGASLTAGGVWTNGSSRNFKERFTTLDGADILSKISGLNVNGWYYKGTNEFHIGPIAEEFYATFNTGNQSNPSQTEKYISSVDPAGVALIGIKELAKQNEILSKQNEEQTTRIKALEEKLERLEKLLVD